MPKKTALYERHTALGGRMVDFAGWLLPVQYAAGPKAEHLCVRQKAGLFDIDHMGQLLVSGPDALPFLQATMTADVSAIPLYGAAYSLLCYEDGGVVDDTFIYRLPDRFFVAINASNNRKDTLWLQYHRAGYDVRLENVSESMYMLALQGPLSEQILQPLCESDLSAMAYHTALEARVAGVPTLLGRTGYTGEDGFELYFPTEQATDVWDALMVRGEPLGLLPIGLAARDSLRFECCMPLYGQELSPTITPLEAGLRWAVAFDKPSFLGRKALLKQQLEGVTRRLVGFRMVEGGVPRHGYAIAVNDQPCGEVTSGMYAPTLDAFLGMGYVPTAHAEVGVEIEVLIRDKPRKAVIVRRPFYAPKYRK